MKHISLLALLISSILYSYACSCTSGVRSVCSVVNQNSFQENGLVWIGEFTGNVVDYNIYQPYYYGNDTIPSHSAHQVKVNEILFGTINMQNTSIQNTDSTVWIVLGSSSTCYQSRLNLQEGTPYLMLSNHTVNFENIEEFENTYSLYSCTADLIPYETQLTAPFYQDIDGVGLSDIDPLYGTTISAAELPQLIETCSALPCIEPPRNGFFNCE